MKFSTKRLLLLSCFTLLSPLGIANAQNADGQRKNAEFTLGAGASQTDYYGGGGGGGYGDWGGGYHASTAQEGMARGMADVIRARGQASVDDARAATEAERARRGYLENRNFAVDSFVENRAIRDAYRATADNSFYKNKDKLAAYLKTKKPLEPLSKSDFYESSGEINWPVGLMHPHDENGRSQIQTLFTKRAQEGSLTSADYVRLTQLIRYWRMHIGSHENFSNSDNKEAARFLLRLEKYLQGDFQ